MPQYQHQWQVVGIAALVAWALVGTLGSLSGAVAILDKEMVEFHQFQLLHLPCLASLEEYMVNVAPLTLVFVASHVARQALGEEADAVGVDSILAKTHANSDRLFVTRGIHVAHGDDSGLRVKLVQINHEMAQCVGDAQTLGIGLLPAPFRRPVVYEQTDTVSIGRNTLHNKYVAGEIARRAVADIHFTAGGDSETVGAVE